MDVEEIWKEIEGYDGVYEISSFGNVKTNTRKVNKGWGLRTIYGIPIKPTMRGKYKAVNLWKNGKSKPSNVHRLVAINFIKNDENKPCVNHIDGNKFNNNVSNLEWCTYSENNKHSFLTGLNVPIRRAGVGVIAFKDNIEYCRYISISDCARQLNVDKGNLQKVIYGKYSHCGGYSFKLQK